MNRLKAMDVLCGVCVRLSRIAESEVPVFVAELTKGLSDGERDDGGSKW